MTATQRLFVYGTLRRQGSHHHLLAESRFLGRHVTPIGYTMLDLGGYPAVIIGGRQKISGEVYQVSRRTLARLDAYENYPDEYGRSRIATAYGPSWIYLWQRQVIVSGYTARPVDGGDWLRGGDG